MGKDKDRINEEESIKQMTANRLGTCRHFNGVQNEQCKAGVRYADVRQIIPKWIFPCFVSDNIHTCEQASFPSKEEAHEQAVKKAEAIKLFLENLKNNICPTCNIEVESHQVGKCVYGSCGHRLYQGKLSKKKSRQRHSNG